jgi:hypothetical protein
MVVVAGDGLRPHDDAPGADLAAAHRELLADPSVAYLRLQHAQGTHLAWMRDFIDAIGRRGPGAPLSMQWEAQHGATVNVVMTLRREEGAPSTPWSLEGWRIERCAVVVADLEGDGARDTRVALVTEADPEAGINHELVHFARTHCEGLLRQAGWRVTGADGPPPRAAFERGMVLQIARWIERVRGWRALAVDVPDRAAWIAGRLGIADRSLAAALAHELDHETPVDVAAAALWASVPGWPAANGSRWEDEGGR